MIERTGNTDLAAERQTIEFRKLLAMEQCQNMAKSLENLSM